MNSIVQGERPGCYVCGRTPTERHHIFGGASRDISEYFGLVVDLCPYHHRDSKGGAHFNPALMKMLKQKGREAFERENPGLDFEAIFIRGEL